MKTWNPHFLFTFLLMIALISCSTENTPVHQLTTSVNPAEAGSVSPADGSFDEGTETSITATANPNWVFDHWEGDASGSANPLSLAMNRDTDLTAFFIKQSYPLTITVEGEGTVQETVLQEKSTDYTYGTLVELTAQPAEGWRFAGWSGAAESNENPIQVTVNEAMELTATFQRKEYALTINTDGQGAVTEDIVQAKSTDYPYGTTVRLTAEGNTGWEFTGWSGDLSGTENPTEITLSEATTITATFEKISYPLTMTIQGEGEVEQRVVQAKSTDYEFGTLVELTAIPAEGWTLSEWTGDIEGNQNPMAVQVDGATDVTATFLPSYSLTTNVKPSGSGRITPDAGEYAQGTAVQVQAIPANEGWKFKGWGGDVKGKESSVSLSMDGDKTITAYFEHKFFDVEIFTEGEGNVEVSLVSGNQEEDTYEFDSILELSAEAADRNWRFMRWEGSDPSESNPLQVTITEDKTIRAVFEEHPIFYLADNGVTIQCPEAIVGETGTVNGIVYEAVDRELLDQRDREGADLTKVCTSLVTNMNSLFYHKGSFNQPIGNWDVSNVTDMSEMFFEASSFNQPIGNWNVSNVVNMYSMFSFADDFDQQIGNWDVSNVTNMRRMFHYTDSFNQPIGNWNVGSVIDTGFMFWHAHVFNQPIGDWNVSNVTDMDHMFSNAKHFNQPIGDWDVSQVTYMKSMFYRAVDFDQPIENWNVSNVTDMEWMFYEAEDFNQPIENWNVNHVTDMQSMFYKAEDFNQSIRDWDVSNVTDMGEMFSYATSFNQSIDSWDVSNVTDMGGIFYEAELFNQNLTPWCVSNFDSEPDNFSKGSSLEASNKPVWGTCPD